MKTSTDSYSQILLQIIIILPFLASLILLIIEMETQKNISLLPPFNINFSIVLITFLSFSSIVSFIAKWKNIDLGFKKLKTIKRILLLTIVAILFFASSFLIVLSLKTNLNYWCKSDLIEKIEITVDDKRITCGRGTDYYIEFSSIYGVFSNNVSHKTFDKFKIGESFSVMVTQGYFEGYYLTQEIK
jgi:amino acid transporter